MSDLISVSDQHWAVRPHREQIRNYKQKIEDKIFEQHPQNLRDKL